MSHAIRVADLSKTYRLYDRPRDRLFEIFTRRPRWTPVHALRNVSFDVEPGHTVGVIGRNGSGKSTLLEIIAGTVRPTSGTVDVEGRVSALLELGAGFDPQFTGRENVYLAGAIQGFSRAEMDERYDDIAKFAEIAEFIDRPVKTYSSGMYVRLAFAVAISMDPDVLLVDEALSVGDAGFQQRCMRRIHQLRENGKTIFFVSHDGGAIQNLCDEAVLLHYGEVAERGAPKDVLERYNSILYESESTEDRDHPQYDHRFGDRRAELEDVSLMDDDGEERKILRQGQRATIRIRARFNEDVADPLVGLLLRERLGTPLIGLNTKLLDLPIGPMQAGKTIEIGFEIDLPILHPGTYSFSAAIADGTMDDHSVCDWMDNVVSFEVAGDQRVFGVLRPDARAHIKG